MTEEGIDCLVSTLQSAVVRHLELSHGDNGEAITRLRHRRCLGDCVSRLRGFITLASLFTSSTPRNMMYREKYFPDSVDEVGEGHELAAEELRLAARSLGHLTNHLDEEELLDVVVEDFRLGK